MTQVAVSKLEFYTVTCWYSNRLLYDIDRRGHFAVSWPRQLGK